MSAEMPKDWPNGALIDAAVRKGVREAVLAHARAGRPVATWRDGQVVWIPPDEILARFAAEAEEAPAVQRQTDS